MITKALQLIANVLTSGFEEFLLIPGFFIAWLFTKGDNWESSAFREEMKARAYLFGIAFWLCFALASLLISKYWPA